MSTSNPQVQKSQEAAQTIEKPILPARPCGRLNIPAQHLEIAGLLAARVENDGES